MIIWIREHKVLARVVYGVLAFAFAVLLLVGGIGTSGVSVSDLWTNNSGPSSSTTPEAGSVGSLEQKVKANPKDAASWSQLADAYASATRPSDEARAWGKVVALKPSDMNAFQRLALAQTQVATNNSNEAQQLQQRALASSPGNVTTFSGGTLGQLTQDPVTQAQAAIDSEQQSKLLTQATTIANKATTWWKRSTATYGKLVALPAFAKNDLAATVWLNYGSAAQSANDTKTAIKAYEAFLDIAPDDVNAPQVRTLVKQLKKPAATDSTTVTTTAAP